MLRKCKLKILVENPQFPSSVIISRPLRLHMYRILGIFPVSEIFRHELSEQRESVYVTNKLQVPDVENVKKLDITKRK